MTTKAEQETIIRWDQEERLTHLFTAYWPDARRWIELGYDVRVYGKTAEGEPRTWRGTAPLGVVRWRRLIDGQVKQRRPLARPAGIIAKQSGRRTKD